MYDFSPVPAQVGQFVRMPNSIIDSYKAGEDIPFGRPLMRDPSNPNVCLRYNNPSPIFSFAPFIGVSGYTALKNQTPTKAEGQYYATDDVSVISAGWFWTTLDTGLTINIDDPCYLNQDSATGFDDFTNIKAPEGDQLRIGNFRSAGTPDGREGKVVFLIELRPDIQHTV
jgi:hypothetical protein